MTRRSGPVFSTWVWVMVLAVSCDHRVTVNHGVTRMRARTTSPPGYPKRPGRPTAPDRVEGPPLVCVGLD